jgi:hypothetical protein
MQGGPIQLGPNEGSCGPSEIAIEHQEAPTSSRGRRRAPCDERERRRAAYWFERGGRAG